MAKRCQICGKTVSFGHRVSKAHNLTKRKFKPNIHKILAKINGSVKRIKVCTRCIRAGKVEKVVRMPKIKSA